MNERKYLFGVELEMSKSARPHIDVNKICSTVHSECDGLQWRYITDRSCGGELVSPILCDANGGLKSVEIICAEVNSKCQEIGIIPADNSCGLHWHFGVPFDDSSTQQIRNIFVIMKQLEPLIFLANPPARAPENTTPGSNFSVPIEIDMTQMARARDMLDIKQVWFAPHNHVAGLGHGPQVYDKIFLTKIHSKPERYDRTRYHGLNICCLFQKSTVEFRYMSGTFQFDKIQRSFNLFKQLMEIARLRPTEYFTSNDGLIIPRSMLDEEYSSIIKYVRGNMREYIFNCFSKLGLSMESKRFLLSRVRNFNEFTRGKIKERDVLWRILA